jgi:diaminohydroxyphosphoribosylaminopyrimidine deaminase/5-amino-6-(5-phosphoribosylamino)uracil reductase
MEQNYELYMRRCLQLAQLGQGNVAPNPMVGAALVFNNRIIGEGYHQQYGGPHAEVNCINSVAETDRSLIAQSTLFVSLEPCAHFGKTPPCADLIIDHKIPTVVIGCRDPFEQVDGKGIEKLQRAGVAVVMNVLEKDCTDLNRRFFLFHQAKRPFIILKWAQSNNKKIGNTDGERVLISNAYSNRLVHQWRDNEPAIMVGTNTALLDNPQLNTRLWPGKNPVRLVVDLHLRLPVHLHLFDQQQPTIVFNLTKKETHGALQFVAVKSANTALMDILQYCYDQGLQSILVEGGARLLQSFIDAGLWDEARVIENTDLIIEQGVAAPELKHHTLQHVDRFLADTIHYYTRDAAREKPIAGL